MRTTGTILATAAGALLLSPSPTEAQPSGTITEGARVRITAPEIQTRPIVGTLVGIEPGGLSLERDGDHRQELIPRTAVRKVEISAGRKSNTRKGALIGFTVGAALAGAFALALASGDWSVGGGELARAVGILGGGGAAVGGLLGAAIKTERWEESSPEQVRVSVVPAPGGGVGVSVRLRLDHSRSTAGLNSATASWGRPVPRGPRAACDSAGGPCQGDTAVPTGPRPRARP